MQWLAEPGPRRPPVAPSTDTSVTHGCHDIRCPGFVMNSQATCGGTSVGTDTIEDRLLGGDEDATARLLLEPATLEIEHPARHVADPVVGLGVRPHPERDGVEPGGVDARLADQRVRLDAQRLDHVVLEQPMDDDHVRPDELLLAGDLVLDRRAEVDDELEVEIGDPRARVALAGRRLADVAPTPPEPEVAALDGVEQHRAVDRALDTLAAIDMNAASPSSLASRKSGRRALTTAPTRSARMSCAWSSSTSAR